MEPALKLNVFVGFPSYGGNGGISSEVPDIREWWVDTYCKMKADPRVGKVVSHTVGDTPITMVRNRFVKLAREQGCHLLLMVDSDQSPNKHKNEPWYKPFWDVAFDEIYRHYGSGPLVIGAPYCGPPGAGENVYVFNFDNYGNHGSESSIRLNQYTRNHAARMSGIQPVAALPTGMILFDMRAFELVEPCKLSQRQVLEAVRDGRMSIDEAERAHCQGWFYYEWKDGMAAAKASTEDVTATRDIALAGQVRLGYNPLRCAWDSWVGHHKPWNVGKPDPYCVENVAKSLRNAVEEDRRIDEVEVVLTAPSTLPPNWRTASTTVQKIAEAADKPAVDWRTVHKTPQADLDALAALVRAVKEKNSGRCRVVEVGSWLGDSAVAMIEAGATSMLLVDNWEPTEDDPLAEAVKGFDRREAIALCAWRVSDAAWSNGAGWDYMEMGSLLASDVLRNTHRGPYGADLIFIDACHTYEAVKADIAAWRQHLAAGGVLAGHDYCVPAFPGVRRAVDEAFGDRVRVAGNSVWYVSDPSK